MQKVNTGGSPDVKHVKREWPSILLALGSNQTQWEKTYPKLKQVYHKVRYAQTRKSFLEVDTRWRTAKDELDNAQVEIGRQNSLRERYFQQQLRINAKLRQNKCVSQEIKSRSKSKRI